MPIAISDPATQAAMTADRTLCLSAPRPTSRAAAFHVSWPMLGFTFSVVAPGPCFPSRPAAPSGLACQSAIGGTRLGGGPRCPPRHELERPGRAGEQQLELAALTWGALHQDVAAVRAGDRTNQRQPEAGAPRRAAVAAAEPVEDVPQQVGPGDPGGVREDHAKPPHRS